MYYEMYMKWATILMLLSWSESDSDFTWLLYSLPIDRIKVKFYVDSQ